MPWHFTLIENVENILRDGLIPQIGTLSQRANEPLPMVHLFSRMEDLENGCNWIDDEFEEDDEHALFYVDVTPSLESGWTEIDTVITPDKLTLITMEFSTFIAGEAHYAMDAKWPSPEDEDRCGM